MEGRAVCVCQPGAHPQEIVPLFNHHFFVVYWPVDYTDLCITFTIVYEFINPSHKLNFQRPGQNIRYHLMK
jgi:hypothetical protein